MSRFEIDFLTEYTDEAVLGELRRIAAMLPDGEPLTKAAFGRLSPRIAHTTIRRRFGGWKNALERAGLGYLYHGQPVSQKMRTQPGRELSNSDLIAELQRVHSLVGKDWLTTGDFNAHSVTTAGTIRSRFGTFRRGLEESDVSVATEPTKRASRTEADCREVRPGLRFKVFMRDRFRCVACGRSPATDLNIELHADHMLAVANGGKTTLDNLQTLCQGCNLGKGRTVVVA